MGAQVAPRLKEPDRVDGGRGRAAKTSASTHADPWLRACSPPSPSSTSRVSCAGGRAAWVGYVRAFAEAAMVGGIADWFAVTALFRRPLGLPIPHTAIIPRSKDRIGAALGRFLVENFLSPGVLGRPIEADRAGHLGAANGCASPRTPGGWRRGWSRGRPRSCRLCHRGALEGIAGSLALAAARATPAAPTAGRTAVGDLERGTRRPSGRAGGRGAGRLSRRASGRDPGEGAGPVLALAARLGRPGDRAQDHSRAGATAQRRARARASLAGQARRAGGGLDRASRPRSGAAAEGRGAEAAGAGQPAVHRPGRQALVRAAPQVRDRWAGRHGRRGRPGRDAAAHPRRLAG